ncbi:pyridoxamine 5'-phosphate oxidase [Oecophyllibacter saccharovorans]|uniref:Pyridoxine/pyridoxamine 5'-phosphate oxidase n=1 Tax=Oecophyllibacter saccharovorans TaxID=2558360 RepID=A0A506UQR4_9PROT|nr:pyridoxamine 5'-phosphate oxidase [Oecophyllibacter saccharovorans]
MADSPAPDPASSGSGSSQAAPPKHNNHNNNDIGALPAQELPDRPLIDLTADPFTLFGNWLHAAEETELNDPNAMAVATATPDGLPSVRILLLKGMDKNGFVFYTNADSLKGEELRENPQAALLFHWKSQRRQVRISGPVQPVSSEEADAYFASRSRLSQLGALASEQSRPLIDRAVFEKRLKDVQTRYKDEENIPRPENWKGYRVVPTSFEFWQERAYRLHDRARWRRPADLSGEAPGWMVTRLYP